LGRDGPEDLPENTEEIGIPFAGRQGHVQVVAYARPVAGFANGAGPRKEGDLVGREIKDVAARIERVLRAVAVMDVPVDDEDAPKAMPADEIFRSDGDVVEKTEAHRPRRLGVVAGRPDQGEGAPHPALHDGVNRPEEPPGREEGRFKSSRPRRSVRVEEDLVPARRRPQKIDVCPLVDPAQLGIGRRAGLDPEVSARGLLLEHPVQDPDALGAFDMAGPHGVIGETVVKNDAGLHFFGKNVSNSSGLGFGVRRLTMTRAPSEAINAG